MSPLWQRLRVSVRASQCNIISNAVRPAEATQVRVQCTHNVIGSEAPACGRVVPIQSGELLCRATQQRVKAAAALREALAFALDIIQDWLRNEPQMQSPRPISAKITKTRPNRTR